MDTLARPCLKLTKGSHVSIIIQPKGNVNKLRKSGEKIKIVQFWIVGRLEDFLFGEVKNSRKSKSTGCDGSFFSSFKVLPNFAQEFDELFYSGRRISYCTEEDLPLGIC